MSNNINISNVPFLDLRAAYLELKADLDAAALRVLDSGWYLLGEELKSFEAEFSAYTESAHCAGVANGLEALVLSLKALGIGPGDEVIVPANTFIATWLAVSYVGARPVPVEPVPGYHTLDAARIEDALSPKTKAIIPVHLYGQPADLNPVLELARRKGVWVIEDAAQAHGARYRGRRIGAHGDLVCWSFYPGKNLGCFGDGGAVTTDNLELLEKIKVLRNYGSKVKYQNEEKGHNSRLDEMQAAFLRVKLKHLDAWNARRQSQAGQYLDALAGLKGLDLPRVLSGTEPVWHLFVVGVDRRNQVQQALRKDGIETLIHYPIPPHLSHAYALEGNWGSFAITERAAARNLSLPIGPHLPAEAIKVITDSLRGALA